MSRPIVEIHVVPGTSVLVTTPDGVDFLINNMDPRFTPAGDPVMLKVLKEEDGNVDVIYSTPQNPHPKNPDAVPPEMEPSKILQELPWKEVNEPLTYERKHQLNPTGFTAPYGGPNPFSGASLDQMLAGAVIPGNPIAAILASTEEAAQAALHAPPPPPLTAAGPSAGASEAPAAAAPMRPGLKAMDTAPRDGTVVMLEAEGMEAIPASWSSAFGRQFWQDSDGEAQGMDDAFAGWRFPTESEREEHGL